MTVSGVYSRRTKNYPVGFIHGVPLNVAFSAILSCQRQQVGTCGQIRRLPTSNFQTRSSLTHSLCLSHQH